MMHSVVAVVGGGHHHTNHLALNATQRTAAVHELTVELEVLPHGAAVNAVNLDDVVVIGNTIILGDLFLRKIRDVSHADSLESRPDQADM